MPVPSTINDLSTTAGANYPAGTESPSTIDDYLRAHASFIAGLRDGKVANTGNETIAGTKTFSSAIVGSLSGNASTATSATTATNLAGGSLGTLPYQTGSGATAQLAAGTSSYLLRCNGAAAPSWTAQSAIDAGSVDGKSFGTFGAAGGILYATSTSDASATVAGTAGQVLVSGGAGAPTWSAQSSLSVGSATNATNVAVTDDTTTNATFYPLLSSAASGNQGAKASSTKFSFNPSTGVLTCTGFAGSLTGNVSGNAGTVTNGVYTVGDQTIAGIKTFSSSPLVPNVSQGDNSTKAANTAFVKLAADTVDARALGVSQSWQDVTASRAIGSTYTNGTNRPIVVNVYAYSSGTGANELAISVGGIEVARSRILNTANGQQGVFVTAIVPAGSSYVVGLAGVGSVQYWVELR